MKKSFPSQLVFATNNSNKIQEVRSLLPSYFEVMSLDQIGCHEELPETSDTIEGNAIQKASYIKQYYDYDVFADDTGLEVAALDGAPGVYSARYAGAEKNNDANLNKLLRELDGREERSARFRTVVAVILNQTVHTFEGICNGFITAGRKGSAGFGYDPVFQPEGHQKTFGEMSLQEKSVISHRGRATRKFVDFLHKRASEI